MRGLVTVVVEFARFQDVCDYDQKLKMMWKHENQSPGLKSQI